MTTAIATILNLPQIEGANLLNLMIVDDERAIREVCRDVAQTLGFHTSIADSAEHAYRVLESNAIDVVLLDLKLPGAGGLEALHQIRERRPDVVIIVVTGYGTVQSAVQAMKNGAYDYVTKPFSMEELRLLLERVSGHLRLKTENQTLREKIKSKMGFGMHRGAVAERWKSRTESLPKLRIATIQRVTSEETHVAARLSQAMAQLRAQEYVAVLIDQAFLETEPVESDMVLEHIGTAIPVHVNFAISGMDRVIRELRAALQRRKQD